MCHLKKYHTVLIEIWIMIPAMKTCMKSLAQEQYSSSFPHPSREADPSNKGDFL